MFMTKKWIKFLDLENVKFGGHRATIGNGMEELGVSSVDHQFILLPFSLEVRIEQNSSRFPLLRAVPSTSRFKLDIRSQRIELELSKRQIVQIQSLAQDWAQFDRARSHRKWRPIVSVHESPKQWWRFAIGRTLDTTRAQRRFFSRASDLGSGSSENPSPAATDVLQQLLTFDLSRLCSRILSP
uniref:VPS13 domain-containing protein n=1 Tax=Globodera pallida TaxID=36090 RepID=A0A183BUE4_GLOPA